MTDKEICEYFDSHPNVTVRELAAMAGISVTLLKLILMGRQNG